MFLSCGGKNLLELNFSESLNKRDFKIEMFALGSNTPKTLIFDGKNQNTIPSEYGENDWCFSYKDSLYAYFRHLKTNRKDVHSYNYNFIKNNDKIQVEIRIDGISKLNKIIDFTSENGKCK